MMSHRTVSFGRPFYLHAVSALVLFWFAVAGAGDSQAQIREPTADFTSYRAVVLMETREPGLEPRLSAMRMYWKKPHLQRTEFLGVRDGIGFDEFEDREDLPVHQIVVSRRDGDRIVETRIQPRFRFFCRTARDADPNDRDDAAWEEYPGMTEGIIRLLESDAVKRIGEKVICGRKAYGYEAPLGSLGESLPGRNKIWLGWADAETGMPLEQTIKADEGVLCRWRSVDPVFDIDLPDRLFRLEVPGLSRHDSPEGWIIDDYSEEIGDFRHKALKPGISLKVLSAEGAPLLTEEDVVYVDYLSRGSDGRGNLRWSISLRLKPRVADRLEIFAEKHPGGSLSVDFNGEMVAEPAIREAVSGRSLVLPMTDLGTVPRAFEKKYLHSREADRSGETEKPKDLVYRIGFKGDGAGKTGDLSAEDDQMDRLVAMMKFGLAEPGIEEVSRRDADLLVVTLGDEATTGIDIPWAEQAVESLLDRSPPAFAMAIVVEEDGDGFDLNEKLDDLIVFLMKKELADGGWSLETDLESLAFDARFEDREARCRWLPMCPENLRGRGFTVKGKNTLDSLRGDLRITDDDLARSVFRLVRIYTDPRWRFDEDALAAVGPEWDLNGNLAIEFELRAERKEDFLLFTESHIRREMAIVIDGSILTDPVLQSELPGGGVISGPPPAGFSRSERDDLLARLMRALVGSNRLEYERLEPR